jgi:dienelactone hydrolase
LVVFSHYSGGHRRTATFLCVHLAGHGYVVAALDHSEVVAKEAADDSIDAGGLFRACFPFTAGEADESGLDLGRVGLVGHSFGGWTALATSEVDTRVRAVVAMAPGGSSNPKPGILPLKLTFNWGRDVPTLYLAADLDVSIPPAGVYELFDRTPSSKRMFVLQRADHQHFLDGVEGAHEAMRAAAFPAEAAWIPEAMRPIAELSSGEQAHVFVRGLTLAHLDAILRQLDAAERFLAGDVEAELSARGVEAFAHPPSRHRMRTFKE